jgi:hypothetical protein
MSNTSLFAFKDDHTGVFSRSTREQEIETFYIEHANAARRMQRFKWIIVGTLLVVGIAAWADERNINDRIRIDSASHSSIREVAGIHETDLSYKI